MCAILIGTSPSAEKNSLEPKNVELTHEFCPQHMHTRTKISGKK